MKIAFPMGVESKQVERSDDWFCASPEFGGFTVCRFVKWRTFDSIAQSGSA
jgi:hypothetical protein